MPADFIDPAPMRRRAVAFDFGARVHCQHRCAGLGDGIGIFQCQIFVFKTQTHFRANRDMFGHALPHGGNDMVNALGRLQQHRAALMFVHRGRGAAEIQINLMRAQSDRHQRVFQHHFRIAAQHLHHAGNAGMGFVGCCDFRHMAQPRCPRMYRVGNPHKFADAFVITADSGQQIAHDKIAQALHGRQHEPAGTGFFGSVVHKTGHFGNGCLNGGILARLPAMQKQPAHVKTEMQAAFEFVCGSGTSIEQHGNVQAALIRPQPLPFGMRVYSMTSGANDLTVSSTAFMRCKKASSCASGNALGPSQRA